MWQNVQRYQENLEKYPEIFADLFEEPKGLPPKREFHHAIPLLPGAKPVNVRQHIYTPEQKDEIERQISKMLPTGITQPSTNPFPSPLLLVAEKDLSWRLRTNFGHLNAITVKNKNFQFLQ
jgi:hypothetical protein